jgi:hypothetical protein
MKVVVRTMNAGKQMKLELWRDLTDGVNGGSWEKVLEHVDAGGWGVDPVHTNSCNIASDYVITEPRPIIIIRNDMVAEQWLKRATIREIQPLP